MFAARKAGCRQQQQLALHWPLCPPWALRLGCPQGASLSCSHAGLHTLTASNAKQAEPPTTLRSAAAGEPGSAAAQQIRARDAAPHNTGHQPCACTQARRRGDGNRASGGGLNRSGAHTMLEKPPRRHEARHSMRSRAAPARSKAHTQEEPRKASHARLHAKQSIYTYTDASAARMRSSSNTARVGAPYTQKERVRCDSPSIT